MASEIRIENTWHDPYVFTLGTDRIVSDEHFLVIYDEHGKIVSDLKLQDLITADELRALPPGMHPFYWMQAAEYNLDSTHGYLSIHLKSGRKLKISLDTGKVEL